MAAAASVPPVFSTTEIQGVRNLDDARTPAECEREPWDALKSMLGGTPSFRVVGSIIALAIQAATRASRVPVPTALDPSAFRDLTILEAVQLG